MATTGYGMFVGDGGARAASRLYVFALFHDTTLLMAIARSKPNVFPLLTEMTARVAVGVAMMALIVFLGSTSTTARALARFIPGIRASISTRTRSTLTQPVVSPMRGSAAPHAQLHPSAM